MKLVYIIGGPTASGKSALALNIAKQTDAVIINGDSQQVYREIPIITAQPSGADMAMIPHALYGHVSVTDEYSMGRWLDEVTAEIATAHARDITPIVVGGTGMYLRALVDGVAEIPPVDTEIREHMRALLQGIGYVEFYAMLAKRDPVMAQRLKAGDTQRVLRAMEVLEQTGQSISVFQAATPKRYVDAEFQCYRVMPEREALYAAIDQRFVTMVAQGGLEEVRELYVKNVSREAPGMKALGVPELLAYLEGEVPLEEATATAQMHSRRYAKRQLTWFRNQAGDWPIVDDVADVVAS